MTFTVRAARPIPTRAGNSRCYWERRSVVLRKWLCSHGLLLTGMAAVSMPLATYAQTANSTEAQRIENLIRLRLAQGIPLPGGGKLSDKEIAVQVKTLPSDRYAIRLIGLVKTPAQKALLPPFIMGLRHPKIHASDIDDSSVLVDPAGLPDLSEAELRSAVTLVIGNANVSLATQPLGSGKFAFVLSSANPLAPEEIDRIVNAVKLVRPDRITLVSHLKPTAPTPAPPPKLPIERIHTLRFLRSALPSGTGQNFAAANPDITSIGVDSAAVKMATLLNGFYPGKASVDPHENRLILRGSEKQVQKLRNMLALHLDVPSPLVRADVFTIQINSTSNGRERDRALEKIEEIKAGVQIIRDFIQGSQIQLGKYIAAQAPDIDSELNLSWGAGEPTLRSLMHQVGFNVDPRRPLNMSEMLVFMALMDRNALQNDLILEENHPNALLTKILVRDLLDVRSYLAKGGDSAETNLYNYPWDNTRRPNFGRHRKNLIPLIDRILLRLKQGSGKGSATRPGSRFLLDRLAKHYDNSTKDADIYAIREFLKAWIAANSSFQDQAIPAIGVIPTENALPDAVGARSAATDFLLKVAMDALTADLQELYYQPLMEWIREEVQGNNTRASGVDLFGTTSIVVRDRTLAESAGTAEAFTKFTPIPKLTEQLLTDAQTLSRGTADTETTQSVAVDRDGNIVRDANGEPVILSNGQSLAYDPAGAVLKKTNGDPVILTVPKTTLPTTALGALTPLQALAVKALFAADADPVYRSVAPGTNLAIRPFVLADGGSARVQLNLVTTIDAQQPDAGAAAQQGRPVDRIKSHSVTTETTISAFDLVEVSTFGAQTTVPGDYTWRIPILASLPILGDLFHGPQKRETHRQDSIAIINLTILPRSLDLVPFFNGVVPGSPAPPVSPVRPAAAVRQTPVP